MKNKIYNGGFTCLSSQMLFSFFLQKSLMVLCGY